MKGKSMFFTKDEEKQKEKMIAKFRGMSIKQISSLVSGYSSFEQKHKAKLDDNEDFFLIRPFIYLLNDYAMDICTLVNARRYNSLMPLMRIFIECYADMKHLLQSYRELSDRSFDEELRLINAATLEQLRREYEAIDEDPTIPAEIKEPLLKERVFHIENAIAEFFPERVGQPIFDTIRDIKREYKLPILKADRVKAAFAKNYFLQVDGPTPLIGINSLYINMCSASHNNVHTVFNRIMPDDNENVDFQANRENEMTDPILHTVLICLQDLGNELSQIIDEDFL